MAAFCFKIRQFQVTLWVIIISAIALSLASVGIQANFAQAATSGGTWTHLGGAPLAKNVNTPLKYQADIESARGQLAMQAAGLNATEVTAVTNATRDGHFQPCIMHFGEVFPAMSYWYNGVQVDRDVAFQDPRYTTTGASSWCSTVNAGSTQKVTTAAAKVIRKGTNSNGSTTTYYSQKTTTTVTTLVVKTLTPVVCGNFALVSITAVVKKSTVTKKFSTTSTPGTTTTSPPVAATTAACILNGVPQPSLPTGYEAASNGSCVAVTQTATETCGELYPGSTQGPPGTDTCIIVQVGNCSTVTINWDTGSQTVTGNNTCSTTTSPPTTTTTVQPPTITFEETPPQYEPPYAGKTTSQICADAGAPSGDHITVQFSATVGSAGNTYQPNASSDPSQYCFVYTSPASPGPVTFSATVTDFQTGKSATATFNTTVAQQPTTPT